MSQEFQREARYAVFKFSKLNGPQSKILQEAMCKLPRVDECLVIESDWPEYEPVWQMIEARMTAAPVPPAGEVEVLKVQYRVSAGPQTGWSLWGEGNGDEFRNSYQVEVRELVDRDHVTRLTAERDALQAYVGRLKAGPDHFCGGPMSINPHAEAGVPGRYLEVGAVRECIPCLVKSRHDWANKANALQSELTKARELLNQWLNMFEGGLKSGDLDSLWNETADYFDPTINQSAPAAKCEHILYRDGDSIGCIPESILDRNGQVALDMCTVCGKAEAELNGPCGGAPVAKGEPDA